MADLSKWWHIVLRCTICGPFGGFPIGSENRNLEEVLLPGSKFRLAVSEKKNNVSTHQRPYRPSCFSKEHKIVGGRRDLPSCQVSLNSVQRFRRRSQKCLIQSEVMAAISFFPIDPKIRIFVEDVEILLPVKLSQSEGRTAILFFYQPEKHKIVDGCWDLAFCQVSLEFLSAVSEEKMKMSQPTETRAAILSFWSAQKVETW